MTIIEDWSPIYQAFYIDKRTNNSIQVEFNLSGSTAIHKGFPPCIHPELLCEHCDTPLSSTFLGKNSQLTQAKLSFNVCSEEPSLLEMQNHSRSHQIRWNFLSHEKKLYKTKEGYLVNMPSCQECEHSPEKSCKCEHCSTQKEENLIQISEQLRLKHSAQNSLPQAYENYSCTQLFTNLFTLTYGISKHNEKFSLSMLDDKSKEEVLKSNLLVPDPSSINDIITMVSVTEYVIEEEKLLYIMSNGISPKEAQEELRHQAAKIALHTERSVELVNLWANLTLDEALGVLRYFCQKYKLSYRPGEKTISTIRKSLCKYGLAQTARYICNAAKHAKFVGLEKGYDSRRSFNLIYSNLNFWVDDERARSYTAKPFNRKTEVLCEPPTAIVFSHSFLDIHGIDYFKDPVSTRSICRASMNN